MSEQKILVLQGLPASGKTTWSREFIKNNKNWKRVNKDELRRMLDAGVWSKSNERQVLQVRDDIICYLLGNGFSIIVDDTNFEERHIQRIKELAAPYNITVEQRMFNVDPTECVKRNELRPEHERVPQPVIWTMYDRYVRPNEYADQSPAQQDESLPHAIICDLDGTLAFMGDRSPYECKKCSTDTLNKTVSDLIYFYMRGYADCTGKLPILFFFSGRDESCRAETIAWLHEQKWTPENNMLIMRKEHDNRKDAVVKLEMYNEHIRGEYYVDFVLDDRDQVVEMWRKTLGLTCLQVNYGNF
jgi:predicted kinase